MDPLSRNISFIRYGVVLGAMCATALGISGFRTTSIIGMAFFALISLKYPLFDHLVRMLRRRWSRLKVLPWLWIGYLLAVMVDVAATWQAVGDSSDANFALAATVFISPLLLAAALILMAIHMLVVRKQ